MPLAADIQAYSALVQLGIATGKLAYSQIRDFIAFLRGPSAPPMTNEQLDAMTAAVKATDEVRKALADAEAGQ